MEIAVHGRHVEVPSELAQQAASKVEHLSKFLHGMERAEVRFSDGKKGHLGDPVTCDLKIEGHGHVVRAAGVGPKADVALEMAVGRAAHRLTRLKDRLVSRSRPRHASGKEAPLDDDEPEAEIEGIEEL